MMRELLSKLKSIFSRNNIICDIYDIFKTN